MEAAFSAVDDADCCFVAVPPQFHEPAIVAAARKGLAVLSEKPLADTWDACARIYREVSQTGVKMQVMQNYRYIATILTLTGVLRGGDLGRVNYVMARFAADYREWLAWGAEFRHTMPHALLLEGAVHHFDQIRNLSQGDCRADRRLGVEPALVYLEGRVQQPLRAAHDQRRARLLRGQRHGRWGAEQLA